MMATAQLLSRKPRSTAPHAALWGEVQLPLARVHELCGAARRMLALRLAARLGGPVLWIAPGWGTDPLNPCGVSGLIEPGEITFVTAPRAIEVLWAMEEALRSGAAPVVVADMTAPPGMTPVRRLHLAAEAGAATGLCQPLGLLLTPGDGGAAGIETRWRCDPAHAPGRSAWRLERLRARMMPPKVWRLEADRLTALGDAEVA